MTRILPSPIPPFVLCGLLFLSSLMVPRCYSQLPPDERRQMIEEFQEANRLRNQERKEAAPLSNTSTKDAGLEVLREQLIQARTAFFEAGSTPNRQAVAQATINYVQPLIALERFDEALGEIKLSVDTVGKIEILIRQWVEIHLTQSDLALEKGDWYGASSELEKALNRARNSKVEGLVTEVGARLRDFHFDWALKFYLEGKWDDARDHAKQALLWKIDPAPIAAFLAGLSYQLDNYPEARKEVAEALSGPYREDPGLVFLSHLIAKESYLERDYRRSSLKDLTLLSPAGFAADARGIERTLIDARTDMEKTYGIVTQLKVRLSVYPRSDYFKFCEAPSWSNVLSVGKKLRVRSDSLRGGSSILRVVMRYAYGLWLVDVWTEGKAPAWFQEGFAHQFAFPTGPPIGGLSELRQRRRQDRLPPVAHLEAPFIAQHDLGEAAVLMVQSQSLVQFLIEKRGLGVPGRILEAFQRQGSFEAALQEATGFDYDSLTRAWLVWIDQAFQSNPNLDQSDLRALGTVSPLGTYWEQ